MGGPRHVGDARLPGQVMEPAVGYYEDVPPDLIVEASQKHVAGISH